MNHEQIEKEEIIEKYILGQLTDTETEAFEAHYFGCSQCFQTLQEREQAIRVIQELPGELLRQSRVKPLAALWDWLKSHELGTQPILVAAAVLILLLVYPAWQGLIRLPMLEKQLQDYQQPQANVPAFFLDEIRAGMVAPAPEIRLEKTDKQFLLNFNILERKLPGSRFKAEIFDQKNTSLWYNDHIRGLGAYEVFSIACPGEFFPPGRYELKVSEIDPETEQTVNSNSFRFEVITVK